MPFSSPRYDNNAIKIGTALPDSNVASLDINITGLTPRGAAALADGIASASSPLVAISIQGQAPSLHHVQVMDLLLQGIAKNPFLTTLNLAASLSSTSNAQGLCTILRASSNSKLQCLKLWTSATCHLQPEDDNILLLGQALANNTSLQELWLGIDEQNQSFYPIGFFENLATRSNRLTKLHVRGERTIAVATARMRMMNMTMMMMIDDNANVEDGDDDGENAMDVVVVDPTMPLLLAMQPLLTSHLTAPTVLELHNCAFPERDWAYLADSLASSTTTISTLSITNCLLTPTSIQHLSRGLCCPKTTTTTTATTTTTTNNNNTNNNGTLQTLRLCRNQLGDEGLQVLLSNGLLHHNPHLTSLALINNQISDVGMSYLAQHLEQRHLDDDDDDDGRTTTTTTVANNTTLPLQHLDLMHNLIGPKGAQQLFEVVATHFTSLQTLTLAENDKVGLEGLALLGTTGLERLQVQSLDLSWRSTWQPSSPPVTLPTAAPTPTTTAATATADVTSCDLTDPPAAAATCSRREVAGLALVHGLQANYHIQELLVNEHEFSPVIRKQIAFYIHLNKCGRRKLLRQCTTKQQVLHSEAIWSHVLAKCGGGCATRATATTATAVASVNNNISGNHKNNSKQHHNHSVLYYFLQQKPDLISGASHSIMSMQ